MFVRPRVLPEFCPTSRVLGRPSATALLPSASPLRLAVLIPAYNAGPDLAVTLASLDSEEGEFDVVVVDDGSVPPVDLSDRVTKRHTVLIRLSSNRGVSEALNAGLGYIFRASYEYVARLDAGDCDHQQRLLTQMLWLDDHRDAAMVGAWTEHVDDEGQLLYVTRYPETWPATLRRFRYRGAFSHPTCMIRTSALRAFGGYRDRYPLGEDYDLFWRIAERYPCINLPEVLVTRLETPRSLTYVHRRISCRVRATIQWQHFRWNDPNAWLGLMRSAAMVFLPFRLAQAVKCMRRVRSRVAGG
jgi:cellulose synthase/poly-beta-1,6-N-acetylglucosamine synthase-like glycosyltransferase